MNKQKMQTPAIEVLAENFWTMRDIARELERYRLIFKFESEQELSIRVEDFDDWNERVYKLALDAPYLPSGRRWDLEAYREYYSFDDIKQTLECMAEDLLDGADVDPREAPDDDCEW